MTTKHRSALKLHLTTFLAVVYMAAWWAFGLRGTRPQAVAPSPPQAKAVIRQAPLVRPVRAVPARPGRIRTRSS